MSLIENNGIGATAAISGAGTDTKQWALDVIATTFSAIADLPAYEEGRSDDLAVSGGSVEVNVAAFEAAARTLGPGELFETSASTGQVVAPTRSGLHEDALQDLHRFKDDFGGAPNFGGHIPRREPNTETFLGIPKETVQTWFSKGFKNYKESLVDLVLHPFYWVGTKLFGVEHPQTKYEYVSKHIESLAWLAANHDVIDQFHSGTDVTARFGEVTGLTCHVRDNGPQGVARGLEEHLTLFQQHYEHNRALGDDALKAFFRDAFDDGAVCFEARASHLIDYARAHPLDGVAIGPAIRDIAAVEIGDVYQSLASALFEERTRAGITGFPKVSEFNAFLQKTYGPEGIVGQQGKVQEGGELRSVTLTAEHHATALQALVEDLFLLVPDDSVVVVG